jgi:GH24 family phage-related lysozyme (muramidase)
MNPAIEKLMEALPGFEGNVPHFYLDGRGNVTIGIGHLVEHYIDAAEFPFGEDTWENGRGTTTQSPNQREVAISGDYEAVRTSKPGQAMHYYRDLCKLTLTAGWAEDDCATRLENEFQPALRRDFRNFDALPIPAQSALLDMAYNLGAGKLREYKNLITAVEGFNFTRAAEECHRRGIQDTRNQWTRDQFIAAESDKEAA